MPLNIKKLSLLALTLIACQFGSHSASAQSGEKTSDLLQRSSASGLVLQTTLTKNYYRSVTVPVSYTEQVPYQDTETYTDYETRYEQEYRCENRHDQQCGYERECRTVPDRQCRQEQVCRDIPANPRCETVTECGVNAHGQRICKERTKCDGRSVPDRQCRYEERCGSWGSRQECSNEYRCRPTVRQECGYVSVPRQVPVTRTRTVTRYRTETRCCRNETQSVFDRQQRVDVVINFPVDAVLAAGEVEQFRVTLTGTEAAPDVQLQVLSRFSDYMVVNRQLNGSVLTLQLASKPVSVDPQLVGESSVSMVRLRIRENNSAFVTFEDQGLVGRVQTEYDVIVRNGAGAVVIDETLRPAAGSSQKLELQQPLSLSDNHTLELRVTRSGGGLISPVQFVKTFFRAWR